MDEMYLSFLQMLIYHMNVKFGQNKQIRIQRKTSCHVIFSQSKMRLKWIDMIRITRISLVMPMLNLCFSFPHFCFLPHFVALWSALHFSLCGWDALPSLFLPPFRLSMVWSSLKKCLQFSVWRANLFPVRKYRSSSNSWRSVSLQHLKDDLKVRKAGPLHNDHVQGEASQSSM